MLAATDTSDATKNAAERFLFWLSMLTPDFAKVGTLQTGVPAAFVTLRLYLQRQQYRRLNRLPHRHSPSLGQQRALQHFAFVLLLCLVPAARLELARS